MNKVSLHALEHPGHDTPKPLNQGSNEHMKIWGHIMSDVHEDLEYRYFNEVTTGYVWATVCSATGMIPTSLCTETHSDYFRPEHLSDLYCNEHMSTRVCSVSNMLPNEYCPASVIVNRPTTSGSIPAGYCTVHKAPSIIPEVFPELITPEIWPFAENPGELFQEFSSDNEFFSVEIPPIPAVVEEVLPTVLDEITAEDLPILNTAIDEVPSIMEDAPIFLEDFVIHLLQDRSKW